MAAADRDHHLYRRHRAHQPGRPEPLPDRHRRGIDRGHHLTPAAALIVTSIPMSTAI
ncbi:hypothetical protein [Mycolicibacterium phocaicum]|uniref:hypothetical protein n=1 Tax=Mycolicibacterium phocaicum TaxID=319706 RepID=UPI00158015ED